MPNWSPLSWQDFDYQQAPSYPDYNALQRMVHDLSQLPPLVTSGEINHLKQNIAEAGRGHTFILQGGDCAEVFSDCRPSIINNKFKILLQMSVILLHGLHKPIVRIGRIAGQYAKPRSQETETIDGITLPSYRGDLVNCQAFDKDSRTANPELLLKGYTCAAMTLNYIRALLDGGFANLEHPKRWNLEFVNHSAQANEYQSIVRSIIDSLELLESLGGKTPQILEQHDFYTSHEALNLHYEQALTRKLSNGLWYNLSTHLPWIGMRTAYEDSAHVEFLRGVENPIGIKVGPSTTIKTLEKLLQILNPKEEEGRILLITRFGAKGIEHYLPPLIKAIQKTAIPVTWSCDPMHGNTEMTTTGVKTRHFDNILLELKKAVTLHRDMGSTLGGVHFELTGENVTECIGGARGLTAEDLNRAYHSLVDPRLNYEQSLEMAIQLSRELKD